MNLPGVGFAAGYRIGGHSALPGAPMPGRSKLATICECVLPTATDRKTSPTQTAGQARSLGATAARKRPGTMRSSTFLRSVWRQGCSSEGGLIEAQNEHEPVEAPSHLFDGWAVKESLTSDFFSLSLVPCTSEAEVMGGSLNQPNAQAFDLFCSVGGLTFGLQRAGMTVNAGLDIDGSCRYAYEKNCKATFVEADIKDISFSDISGYFGDADYRVLVGCAPCQPFSSHTAKIKAYQSDLRWKLIDEFLRIILEGRPEILSMENVPQLMDRPIYGRFKRALTDAGYTVSDGVISCADFGVPQRRYRLVMLASLSELGGIDMPNPTGRNPKTVRQAIGQLAPLEHGQSSLTDPLHVCSRLEPLNLKRIQASKPGGSWRDWPAELLPDCYKKTSGLSYGSVYGRMEWDRVGPTLTTQFYRYGTGRFGHPEQDRALSLREGAHLQTFPEEYQFCPPGGRGSFSRIGRHIGNAVPPSLATAIGKTILTHLRQKAERNG